MTTIATPTSTTVAPTTPNALTSSSLLDEAREIQDWMVAIRRDLHAHPELMYDLERTSGVVQRTLDELGIPYKSNVAKTGVVAIIGTGEEPCVALRADMDALPIHEEANVEFRSKTDGKMHACGHDCHTAMLLGAAKLLKKREANLKGTIKLIFQPAEEGGAGGKMMCEEGVMSNPTVSKVFGLHVWPFNSTGTIGGRAGAFLAAAGIVEIEIEGKGGHAAMPHLAIDPITTAGKIIVELQTIVSREVDPLDPAVVTLATIEGGSAFNVIPQSVKITGTIRSLRMKGLEFLQERIKSVAEGIAIANRCTARVTFPGNDYPPTVNDAECWGRVQQLAEHSLPGVQILELQPVMGGEDFAYYGDYAKSCFVALGVKNEAIGAVYPVHHPKFMVDEAALPYGVVLHATYALDCLES